MHSPTHISRVSAVIVASFAGLVLASCGQSSTPSRPPSTATAAPASTITVQFGEYFYRPRVVTVHVGQPVRFVNAGKIAHTVADSTPGGQVRSAVIQPRPLEHGRSQTVTFARTGVVHYLCTFHPTLMRGTITVTP